MLQAWSCAVNTDTMSKETLGTKFLLVLVNVLMGLALYMGYRFADHTEAMLTQHEQRLDQLSTQIAKCENP